MSTISKSGITAGSIIKSEHVLRIINALSGDTAADVTVDGQIQGTTGLFTTSLRVTGPITASGLLAGTSSWANNATSSSYSVTSSYVNNQALYISSSTPVFAVVSSSYNYADDTTAATGGIPLGGLYHTSGTLKIRLT